MPDIEITRAETRERARLLLDGSTTFTVPEHDRRPSASATVSRRPLWSRTIITEQQRPATSAVGRAAGAASTPRAVADGADLEPARDAVLGLPDGMGTAWPAMRHSFGAPVGGPGPHPADQHHRLGGGGSHRRPAYPPAGRRRRLGCRWLVRRSGRHRLRRGAGTVAHPQRWPADRRGRGDDGRKPQHGRRDDGQTTAPQPPARLLRLWEPRSGRSRSRSRSSPVLAARYSSSALAVPRAAGPIYRHSVSAYRRARPRRGRHGRPGTQRSKHRVHVDLATSLDGASGRGDAGWEPRAHRPDVGPGYVLRLLGALTAVRIGLALPARRPRRTRVIWPVDRRSASSLALSSGGSPAPSWWVSHSPCSALHLRACSPLSSPLRRSGSARSGAQHAIAWQVGAAAAGGSGISALIGLLDRLQTSLAVLGPAIVVLALILFFANWALTALAPI